MVPFITGDMFKLLKVLLQRFIKPAALSLVTTSAQLMKIDVDKKDDHLEWRKIDVGFSAETMLKELTANKKISDKAAMEFRMECKQFLLTLVKKAMTKAPIVYSLARNMSALDPREMTTAKLEKTKVRMKGLVRSLIEANHVSSSDADDTIQQYSDFVQESTTHSSEFTAFDPMTGRVDALFHDKLTLNSSYKKLWSVVKILVLLSHRQATVERGFSVNKEVETVNQVGDTFVSKRLICDYVRCAGGILNIDVMNKQLQLSASGARLKYNAYLEEEKKKSAMQSGQKRKAVSNEIEQLKKKKQCLINDIEAMNKSADDYAEKAEKCHDLTFVAKSNSLRRSAKEKNAELKSVNDQLEAACLQLGDG